MGPCSQGEGATPARCHYNQDNLKLAQIEQKEITSRLITSKKRKFAPWYSAPTEMMIIALAPTYISKPAPDKGGIGARRDPDEGMEHRIAFNMALRRQAKMNLLEHKYAAKKENARLLAHTRATVKLP